MNTWCCLLSSFRDIWDTENPIQIDTTNTFRVVLLEAGSLSNNNDDSSENKKNVPFET